MNKDRFRFETSVILSTPLLLQTDRDRKKTFTEIEPVLHPGGFRDERRNISKV